MAGEPSLHAPEHKDDWDVGLEFFDVRVKPSCHPDLDTCYYPNGTLSETVPLTVTTQVEGIAPVQGRYLAVIRDAENGLTDPLRYQCDRATESLMVLGQVAWTVDLADNEDGWGCPPCPD